MPFGETMRKIRMEKEITLRDVGRHVGLSPIYLSDIERSQRRPPSPAIVMKIADALGVDPDPLLVAAMEEREGVEFTATRAAEQEALVALARVWEEMDDEAFERLKTLLENERRKT